VLIFKTPSGTSRQLTVGEGPEYRPFSDLRSVPRLVGREQVENHGRACTQVSSGR